MDNELKNFRLNINQIAAMTGLHRQTIASRLSNIPLAEGSNQKLKLYSVLDILTVLLTRTADPSQIKVDEMLPPDRKAWFQSERERLKFEQETAQLIPAEDVRREFSLMAKAMVQVLETLPDILERDCGLQPGPVARVQSIIDDVRDQIAQRVIDSDQDENGGEEPEE
ncbi:DUF1441 family protein [Lelliottia sp. V89_10]|uniref:DUF1441 family protein n=1 Tax=Lelliottia wanjuensis TaxID=3050585 RepID=UPI00249EDAC4|nr:MULTISPECIES: DUF1441 family protein [unclassified Lelliottia]MDI3359767.1 DUF1441 family protein [Lelliottia sp. V89_13]MDK9548725.1 DUF1441 family protein [Lelliottia sp. V89_5]MDK9597357.1 DUF1441 family protein [Lelliottia sp. V89_10]